MSTTEEITKPVTRYPLGPRDEFGTNTVDFCFAGRVGDIAVWKLSGRFSGFDESFVATVHANTNVVQDVRYHPVNRRYGIRVYCKQFIEHVKFPVRGELTVTRRDVDWNAEAAKRFFACYRHLIKQHPPPSYDDLEVEDVAMGEAYIEAMNANQVSTEVIDQELTDSY